MPVKPVPDGYQTITPYLVVDGASELIDFLKRAFAATESFRMPMPGGKLGHAELRVGTSVLMLADCHPPEYPPRTGNLHLYVPDADATFNAAVAAGGKVTRPLENMFYGDRIGSITDRWGNTWSISTHVEDVSPDEMQRRMARLDPMPVT